MSVRRDSSADAAAALEGAVAAGGAAFRAGAAPTEAQHRDTAFMAGWMRAALDAAHELATLRQRLAAIEAQQATARRDGRSIVTHMTLIREALEAGIPVWNICRPAKPNPRQSQQIAGAIAKTEAALEALASAARAPAPKPRAKRTVR